MYQKRYGARFFLTIIFAALILLGTAVVVEAQNKTRAAYVAISGIFTPVWIAADERLYQKHQIDVDTVFIGGSPSAVGALVAGEVDVIYGGADPIVAAILNGAELTLAGFISHTTPISLYVPAGISTVDDLKGKTVAVTRFASSTTYMVKVCLAQHRMEPSIDVAIIQSGGYPESVVALQSGRVQGAMLAPPFSYKAEALGFKRKWNGSV
jgi:NitT/TauT family transport system substrate-binding protein